MGSEIIDDSKARVLRLTLTHSQLGEVSAQWQNNPDADYDMNAEKTYDDDGYVWPPYQLIVPEVTAAAEEVDRSMKAMIALGWPDIFDLLEGKGKSKAKAPDYAAELRAVAEAGQRLRSALVTPKPVNQKIVRALQVFRDWFDEHVMGSAPGTWRIEVVTIGFLPEYPRTIPWGLCCDPPADEHDSLENVDVTNPDNVTGFWCQRYGLAVRGKDAHVQNFESKRGGSVKMLVVLETPEGGKSQFEETAPRMVAGGRDQTVWEEHFAQDAQTYKRKVNDVIGQREEDSYVYISLQANPEDPGYNMVTVPDIKRLRGTSQDDLLMLVVLDGDAVIRGDRGMNWLDNLMDIGQNGLIVTEVDVANPKLRFFGWLALTHILNSRKPIIRAVREFRRSSWPLGLIYGVYCNPLHAYVDPPPEEDIKKIAKLLKERRHVAG